MNIQMATIQIEQSLADTLLSQAQASGLSLGDSLKNLVLNGQKKNATKELASSEIDLILDELSEVTEPGLSLPQNFSRADIYFDHD